MKVRMIGATGVFTLGALLGALTLPFVSSASTPTTSNLEPAGTPTASTSQGVPAVGALFPPGSTTHICTASVLDSPAGNLLITAAHCLSGTMAGYTFAPGYHNGIAPYGYWTVTKAYGPSQWVSGRNNQDDFGFLVVAPHTQNGKSIQIQSVTGGNRLGTTPSAGQKITITAYSAGVGGNPITCATTAFFTGKYPTFNCTPYVDGTSGAPFLTHTAQGWEVVGVIGGFHQGGCYPWTSYSSAFGSATESTYTNAVKNGTPTIFSSAGTDGCTTGL